MTVVLYGIKNCDTVRKARRHLDTIGVEYQFHDVRSDGLNAGMLGKWIEALGWEAVINRRSSSWKTLPESQRSSMNSKTAVEAALAMPTLIKRPLLQHGDHFEIGFDAESYSSLFAH